MEIKEFRLLDIKVKLDFLNFLKHSSKLPKSMRNTFYDVSLSIHVLVIKIQFAPVHTENYVKDNET